MKTSPASKLRVYDRFSGSIQNANLSSATYQNMDGFKGRTHTVFRKCCKMDEYLSMDGQSFDRLEQKFKALVVRGRLTVCDGKRVKAHQKIKALRDNRRNAKKGETEDVESQGFLTVLSDALSSLQSMAQNGVSVNHNLSPELLAIFCSASESLKSSLDGFTNGVSSLGAKADGWKQSFTEGGAKFLQLIWVACIIGFGLHLLGTPGWTIAGLLTVIGIVASLAQDNIRELFLAIKEYLTKISGPTAQSGLSLDSLGHVLALCCTFFSVPKGVDWQKAASIVNSKMSHYNQSVDGWGRMAEFIFTRLECMLKYITDLYGVEPIRLSTTGHELVDSWCDRVGRLLMNYNVGNPLGPDEVMYLQALVREGDHIATQIRWNTRAHNVFVRYQRDLTALCVANGAALNSIRGQRVQPVCWGLTGAPGIGKTLLCAEMMSYIIAHTMPVERVEEIKSNLLSEVFQKGSSPYWEGYTGQYGVVMDDFGQSRVAIGSDEDNDYMMLIRMINMWAYPLNFADLNNKGKNFFRSKAIMLTTNLSTFTPEASKVVNDLGAVYRRIHFPLRLGVKRQFCRVVNGAVVDSLAQNALDYEAFCAERDRCEEEGIGFPWHVWFVRDHDFQEGVSGVHDEELMDVMHRIINKIRRSEADHMATMTPRERLVQRIIDERRQAAIQPQGGLSDLLEPGRNTSFFGRIQEGAFEAQKACEEAVIALQKKLVDMRSECKKAFEQVVESIKAHPVLSFLTGSAFVFGLFGLLRFCVANCADKFVSQSNSSDGALNERPVYADTLRLSIVRNMLHMTVVDENKNRFATMGTVLGLRDRIIMIPKHFLADLEQAIKSKQIDGRHTIQFTRLVQPGFKFELTYEVFCKLRRYESTIEQDFLALDLANHVGLLFKDITNKFVREADLEYFRKKRQIGVILEGVESNGREITRLMRSGKAVLNSRPITVGHTTAPYRVSNCWDYDIPTVRGDCGNVLFVDNNESTTRPRVVCGFHTGGALSLGRGYSVCITQELLQCLPPKKIDEIEHNNAEIVSQANSFAVGGSFVPLYKTNLYSCLSPDTAIVKTVLHNNWFCSQKEPAMLKPFVNDEGVCIKPMVNALVKYNGPLLTYDEGFVSRCSYVAFQKIFELTVGQPRFLLTYEQAVAGIPGLEFFDSIPRSTSAGYPYCLQGHNGKKKFFGTSQNYDFSNSHCKKLFEEVLRVEELAKRGERSLHVFVDFLKDEKRSFEKVAKGETRLISSAPLVYTILFRKYFMCFMASVMKNRIYCGVAAGVNPYNEWNMLARELLTKGNNFVAGDFYAFDSSQQPQIQNAILDRINDWYDDGPENSLVRRVLWLEVTNSRHLGGSGNRNNTIYEWNRSMPSGHPGTTTINSFYNLILFVMSFERCCGRPNVTDFWNEVSIAVLGDDNVLSISSDRVLKFNQKTIGESMAEFGMTYTNEKKAGEVGETRTIEDVDFLKRSFRLVREGPLAGTFVAPLSIGTIVEMPYWCKNKNLLTEITQDTFETALMELSAHPKEVWDVWSPLMCSSYRRAGFRTLLPEEQEQYFYQYCNGTVRY